MATHKSAEKRNRQNKVRRLSNSSVKSRVKTSIKKVLEAVSAKDQATSTSALKKAVRLLDKAAAKKTLHKNTASRKVSRLTKKVNALGA